MSSSSATPRTSIRDCRASPIRCAASWGCRSRCAAPRCRSTAAWSAARLPDAALALNVMLARLYWKNGKLPVPHIYDRVRPLTEPERKTMAGMPLDVAKLRQELGVLPSVSLATETGTSIFEQTWRKPAVTIIAQEASSIQGASNQVLPKAAAIVSCRIVPDQDPEEVFSQLKAVLTADPPWGVEVSVKPAGPPVKWWMTDPQGPAFEAATKAMRRRLRQGAAQDRLRRQYRFRRSAGRAVRRRTGAAARHRGSLQQRPRPQRKPARSRLAQPDAAR